MRRRASQRRHDWWRHYKWAAALLAGLVAACAIINLIQNGFDIDLHWGFSHFVDYYRQIVTPIIDVIQWPVRWALAHLHIDWTIPQWLKDMHALSFTLATIYARGWGDSNAMAFRAAESIEPSDDPDDPSNSTFDWRSPYDWLWLRQCIVEFVRPMAGAVLLGFSGLSIVAWLYAIIESTWAFYQRLTTPGSGASPWGIYERLTMPAEPFKMRTWDLVLFRTRSLLLVTMTLATAVITFYVGNAIAPQLGF